MNADTSFYDGLAPFYHLIHQDWSASIERQGNQPSALFENEWPGRRAVLDVAGGIGGIAQCVNRIAIGFRQSATVGVGVPPIAGKGGWFYWYG